MKVRVILPIWGNYKKGDELELPESTAIACEKVKAVEIVGQEKQQKTKKVKCI